MVIRSSWPIINDWYHFIDWETLRLGEINDCRSIPLPSATPIRLLSPLSPVSTKRDRHFPRETAVRDGGKKHKCVNFRIRKVKIIIPQLSICISEKVQKKKNTTNVKYHFINKGLLYLRFWGLNVSSVYCIDTIPLSIMGRIKSCKRVLGPKDKTNLTYVIAHLCRSRKGQWKGP